MWRGVGRLADARRPRAGAILLLGMGAIAAVMGAVVVVLTRPYARVVGVVISCEEIQDSKPVREDRLARVRTETGQEVKRTVPAVCCASATNPPSFVKEVWSAAFLCGGQRHRDINAEVATSFAVVAGFFIIGGAVLWIARRG
jgi:hypothetical protein